MSKSEKEKQPKDIPAASGEAPEETVIEAVEILDEMPPDGAAEAAEVPGAAEQIETALREQEDKYMRLLAEYDNFRRRSIKEREMAWSTAKSETAAAFFPVYDNLERALKQESKDEAYAKGVLMTMQQLKSVLEKLGIEEIPALGAVFDPELHNAVMHVEDEDQAANVIVEVFQTGFRTDGKVIRHAMVKVAN